jgi:hypothetical protein
MKQSSEHAHARLLPRRSQSWIVLLPSDTNRNHCDLDSFSKYYTVSFRDMVSLITINRKWEFRVLVPERPQFLVLECPYSQGHRSMMNKSYTVEWNPSTCSGAREEHTRRRDSSVVTVISYGLGGVRERFQFSDGTKNFPWSTASSTSHNPMGLHGLLQG